jgi:hypothetical protein
LRRVESSSASIWHEAEALEKPGKPIFLEMPAWSLSMGWVPGVLSMDVDLWRDLRWSESRLLRGSMGQDALAACGRREGGSGLAWDTAKREIVGDQEAAQFLGHGSRKAYEIGG